MRSVLFHALLSSSYVISVSSSLCFISLTIPSLPWVKNWPQPGSNGINNRQRTTINPYPIWKMIHSRFKGYKYSVTISKINNKWKKKNRYRFNILHLTFAFRFVLHFVFVLFFFYASDFDWILWVWFDGGIWR
jgi:hypothetical protein